MKRKHQSGGTLSPLQLLGLPPKEPDYPVLPRQMAPIRPDAQDAMARTLQIFQGSRPEFLQGGGGGGFSNKSKSKDRYREKAYGGTFNKGGDIGAVIGAAAPLLSLIPGAQPFAPIAAGVGSLLQMSSTFMPDRKPTGGSPGSYNTGGHINLNSQSLSR